MNDSRSAVHLSIVIVNWNTSDLLQQCLESVYAHSPGCDFEILVVDNASTDDSVERVRQDFPKVRLIENIENLGYARGNNQAIRESRGRYLLLLNSDAVLTEGALQTLLECMEAHLEAGACGPMLINADGTFQASFADFPTLFAETMHQFGLVRFLSRSFPSYSFADSQKLRVVDWVGGACLLARRTCLREVGLLDESFVMYGEELDWCYRIRQRGWAVYYCPDARVVHLGGRSSDKQPTQKYVRIQQGKVRFFRKHYSPALTRTLAAIIRTAAVIKTGCYLATTWPAGQRHRSMNSGRWRTYWATVWAPL